METKVSKESYVERWAREQREKEAQKGNAISEKEVEKTDDGNAIPEQIEQKGEVTNGKNKGRKRPATQKESRTGEQTLRQQSDYPEEE